MERGGGGGQGIVGEQITIHWGYRIQYNSMPQEGVNRSITCTDYAQTKFTNFGPNVPSGHNYVPFLNKSLRFPSKKDVSAPPIGTYNLPSCFQRKKSPFEDRISHFLIDALPNQQQMVAFKSSLTRFHQPSSNSPGPASYNLFNDPQNQPKSSARQQKENQVDLARTCPSIPHKGNKYGYALVNGEMRKIDKSEQQLAKERESRKNYAQTLDGENRHFRQSAHRNFHDTDARRKLYEHTSKLLERREKEGNCKSESFLLKKPHYEHLYNSKPVPLSNEHRLIGPGQYQISSQLSTPMRREKFQFFGSTQVRFKERGALDKGYSLLEMIKENNQSSFLSKEKRSPFRKNKANHNASADMLPTSYPGPGQYNPQINYSKQSRRTAFFPLEQRFKEPVVDSEEEEEEIPNEFGRSKSKKSHNSTLKKERFKPMHQQHQPVRSEQICGIVAESSDGKADIRRSPKLGKPLKLKSKGGSDGQQQINAWSREEGRKNGGYMRELKDELAFISYSPHPQDHSKKRAKKLAGKQGE